MLFVRNSIVVVFVRFNQKLSESKITCIIHMINYQNQVLQPCFLKFKQFILTDQQMLTHFAFKSPSKIRMDRLNYDIHLRINRISQMIKKKQLSHHHNNLQQMGSQTNLIQNQIRYEMSELKPIDFSRHTKISQYGLNDSTKDLTITNSMAFIHKFSSDNSIQIENQNYPSQENIKKSKCHNNVSNDSQNSSQHTNPLTIREQLQYQVAENLDSSLNRNKIQKSQDQKFFNPNNLKQSLIQSKLSMLSSLEDSLADKSNKNMIGSYKYVGQVKRHNKLKSDQKYQKFNQRQNRINPFQVQSSFTKDINIKHTESKHMLTKSKDFFSRQSRDKQKMVVIVNRQTKSRMKDLITQFNSNARKQVTNNTVRTNLLKRIEQKAEKYNLNS